MRFITVGASILVGVGFATLVATSAVAAPANQQVAQAAQQKMIACQRESQWKIVGNRPTITQEREAYVKRCVEAR